MNGVVVPRVVPKVKCETRDLAIDQEQVRCDLSASLLRRLLRQGDVVAADIGCLDRSSALTLRRCILQSCQLAE